jgi:hypothetical protein
MLLVSCLANNLLCKLRKATDETVFAVQNIDQEFPGHHTSRHFTGYGCVYQACGSGSYSAVALARSFHR